MATAAPRPRGMRLLAVALRRRTSASMLGFGFSSGLPYALLIGTLNAWLGDAHVNLATIGVLSWIGLAYAFKFLWSPVVDRVALPGLSRIGRRKSWIALAQAVMLLAFAALAFTDPAVAIGRFAGFAVIAALASATQDVAVDAWRIDVADESTPVELLSAIYQFGYRIASIIGGAFALFLAARMPWPTVFLLMAAVFAALIVVTLLAPDTPRPAARVPGTREDDAGISPRARLLALAVVCLSWTWAVASIALFMVRMLTFDPAASAATSGLGWQVVLGAGSYAGTGAVPQASDFLKHVGSWIVATTVVVPLVVAALVNRAAVRSPQPPSPVRLPGAADHLYRALIAPLAELTGRLGWGVLVVMGFILTYQLCFNIWSSFAYPFYLQTLHYSKDEVAFASKLFGILMTMAGIALAATLFARIGRFPTMMVGAVLPILGNLLYADLADGGAGIDAAVHLVRLDALAASLGSSERMVRLLVAIAFENVSTGIAGAAFVAYVSSIVSKRFAAVQYALLSSLTFLIGSLARGVAGQGFDAIGYGPVFRYTALIGLSATLFVALEWWRASRLREFGDTGSLA